MSRTKWAAAPRCLPGPPASQACLNARTPTEKGQANGCSEGFQVSRPCLQGRNRRLASGAISLVNFWHTGPSAALHDDGRDGVTEGRTYQHAARADLGFRTARHFRIQPTGFTFNCRSAYSEWSDSMMRLAPRLRFGLNCSRCASKMPSTNALLPRIAPSLK